MHRACWGSLRKGQFAQLRARREDVNTEKKHSALVASPICYLLLPNHKDEEDLLEKGGR